MNTDGTSCRVAGRFRALMAVVWGTALSTATIGQAADIPGAEVLEKGQSVITVGVGLDLPQTAAYSAGYHYAPFDRLQIGVEGSTLILANGLSLTSRFALLRSENRRFQLSAQGSIRGVYVPAIDTRDGDDKDFSLDPHPEWDEVALLVLEPRVAAEFQPVANSRWRVFTELGTQHHYGTVDGDRFLNGGNRDHSNWAMAFRATAGFAFPLRPELTISAQGGVWGSFEDPLPVVKVSFALR